jgi:proprotein convertase subtilisin/kexin type 5
LTPKKECVKCHFTCENCSGPLITECTSCPAKRFMNSEKSCVVDCGVGFYNNVATKKCSVCDDSCQDCFAAGKNSCITCNPGFLLKPDNSCFNTCGEGRYFDVNSPTGCANCDNSCKDCKGPTNQDCRSCKDNFNLTPTLKCVEKCEEGTFLSEKGICSNCHDSCQNCNGFGSRSCLDCPVGKLFVKKSKMCVSPPCPQKTF